MAIVTTNPLVSGLRGMLGRTLVFKTLYGKTIVASRPRSPKTQTEKQKANRNKFREATRWAHSILLNPERKAYYQRKAKQLNLPNAYTAAITYYMRKPVVTTINQVQTQVSYSVRKKGFALKQVAIKKCGGQNNLREHNRSRRLGICYSARVDDTDNHYGREW